MRKFLRLAVAWLALLVAFFYPLLAPTAHRIDDEHFQLIKTGMTAAEVEAIFGVPPGGYDWAVADFEAAIWLIALAEVESIQFQILDQRLVQYEPGIRIRTVPEARPATTSHRWLSRHGNFSVSIDADGRVVSKIALGKTRVEYPWRRWWQKLTGK
jgi:hypothetical protein